MVVLPHSATLCLGWLFLIFHLSLPLFSERSSLSTCLKLSRHPISYSLLLTFLLFVAYEPAESKNLFCLVHLCLWCLEECVTHSRRAVVVKHECDDRVKDSVLLQRQKLVCLLQHEI